MICLYFLFWVQIFNTEHLLLKKKNNFIKSFLVPDVQSPGTLTQPTHNHIYWLSNF